MPQNMQKRQKVAQLDLDEAEDFAENEEQHKRMTAEEIAQIEEDDPLYQAALKHWRHGKSPKQIATQLVRDGVIERRTEAHLLAERVIQENPEEQVTNARILFGAAVVIAVIAILVIIPDIMAQGIAGILQPTALFLLVAGWFAFKGYQTWQKARQ